MLTMPIAGRLVDRLPIGRIVPFGIITIIIGLSGLTQIGAETPYWQVSMFLFIMGLGMGGTMMPLFTSALKNLAPSRGRARIDAAQRHQQISSSSASQ